MQFYVTVTFVCPLRPNVGESYSHLWAPRHCIQPSCKTHHLVGLCSFQQSPLSNRELLEGGNQFLLINLAPQLSQELLLENVQ